MTGTIVLALAFLIVGLIFTIINKEFTKGTFWLLMCLIVFTGLLQVHSIH